MSTNQLGTRSQELRSNFHGVKTVIGAPGHLKCGLGIRLFLCGHLGAQVSTLARGT